MAKSVARYIGLIINRAAKGSVLLSDRITVLIVPFSTLMLWLLGVKMSSSISETIAAGIAMTMVTIVLLRIVASIYLLWKDDQAEKSRLEGLLNRPYQRQHEVISEYSLKLRIELSETLAKILSICEMLRTEESMSLLSEELVPEYMIHFRRSRELINALSYDVPLRIVCFHFTNLASKIMRDQTHNDDCSDHWEKMKSLKKITFSLLHKQEGDKSGEIISMFEAENIMNVDPKNYAEGSDDETVSKFRNLASKLRHHISDPEMLDLIRESIRTGENDPGKIVRKFYKVKQSKI